MSVKRCDNCRNWKPTKNNLGECRANPPTVGVVVIDTDAEPITAFPETKADDWCGHIHYKEDRP